MTSPATTSASPKVEDLVKKALKEALDKRKPPASSSEAPITMKEEEVIACETDEVVTSSSGIHLEPNQRLFSTIIDKPVTKEFAVTVFEPADWDEAIADFIPKINESYVIDEDLASSILQAWELNEKVLCYGPTGAGKSSLIEQLCARTNRPFVRVNCTGDMDSSMIFGQLTAKDGSTIWVDGAVTEAVRYGAVFAWDEWDVTPPEISMGLQWLLEDDGKLFLKEMPGSTSDKQITPHKDFRIVAIGNTQGQGDETGAHAGTNVQNSATLDRFGTAVFVDYLAPHIEEKMIHNKFPTTITKGAAKELVKLANLLRQGYKSNQLSLTISPRSLFGMCRKVSVGYPLRKAFTLVYLNKLNDTQRKVANELFTRVYGTKAD